jgi:beta-lactamase class A
VDLGWPGVLNAVQNSNGIVQPPLNDVITLAGSARDFVSWYEQALQDTVFFKPETLRAFKRFQSESIQIPLTIPADTPAYAKGGEFPALRGSTLNAESFAGQMIVNNSEGTVPVTFGFVVNWDGPASGFDAVQAEFFAAIQDILEVIKQAVQ